MGMIWTLGDLLTVVRLTVGVEQAGTFISKHCSPFPCSPHVSNTEFLLNHLSEEGPKAGPPNTSSNLCIENDGRGTSRGHFKRHGAAFLKLALFQ